MSEYYLGFTGAQLDDAINKVRSGYILPSEIINISSNVQDMDIKKGKLDIAPLNRIPLLPSGPGGFCRSWSYKTYPLQKYTFF